LETTEQEKSNSDNVFVELHCGEQSSECGSNFFMKGSNANQAFTNNDSFICAEAYFLSKRG